MQQQRVEKIKLKLSKEDYNLIYNACVNANNLYNHANYIVRQKFIETSKLKEQGKIKNAIWLRYEELDKILKNDKEYPDYYRLPLVKNSQQILRLVDKNWKSFFESIKDWKKNPNKYKGRPKLPKYREKQKPFMLITVSQNGFHIKNNELVFTKALNNIRVKITCNQRKDFIDIQQARFRVVNKNIELEIIYKVEVRDEKVDNKRYCSIDLGVDNLLAITNNVGEQPILVNGKGLKSINQYYNKKLVELKSVLKKCQNKYWSNQLQRLTRKRNNKIDYELHKISKWLVNYCKENNINTIVIGQNKGWKQESEMSKKNNQNFIQIPFTDLIQKITYKAQEQGIKVIMQEESYTSKASFINNDDIPIYKEDDNTKCKFSGYRQYRGWYKIKNSKQGINADINGSYNIMKKALGVEYNKGLKITPKKIKVA